MKYDTKNAIQLLRLSGCRQSLGFSQRPNMDFNVENEQNRYQSQCIKALQCGPEPINGYESQKNRACYNTLMPY